MDLKKQYTDFIKSKSLDLGFLSCGISKSGFLASDTIYFSIAHTDQILKKYLIKLESIFAVIGKCEKSIENIDNLIENQVSKLNMKRMN